MLAGEASKIDRSFSILSNNLPTISILNGPVQAGFNGELISMMMTFKNYELDLSTFTFNYDGQKIVGEYRETTVDFGPSLNLGIKAAALGSLLENSNCSGEIKFIGSEELIDTNIHVGTRIDAAGDEVDIVQPMREFMENDAKAAQALERLKDCK